MLPLYTGGEVSGIEPTDDFAELKRQLDVADADIALVNERLDDARGMQFLGRHLVRVSFMPVSYNVCA